MCPDVSQFIIVGTADLEDDSVTAAKIASNVDVTAKGFDAATVGGVAATLMLSQATQPINSAGNSFSTVQAAIDDLAGAGWVYVPPGTYNESVGISNNDVILFGAGWSSIINGGTTGDAVFVSGVRCVVRDLQVQTTQGGGETFGGIQLIGADNHIYNVFVNGSDDQGMLINGAFARVDNYLIRNTDGVGIIVGALGDNAVITGGVVDTTGDDGIVISINAEDCVAIGNRITAFTGEAIDDDSGTSLTVTATDGDPLNEITV